MCNNTVVTATGFDYCDVYMCLNPADVILDTVNYDRFCVEHYEIAQKVARSQTVPPDWYNVIGNPTYGKGNTITFPVKCVWSKLNPRTSDPIEGRPR